MLVPLDYKQEYEKLQEDEAEKRILDVKKRAP